MAKIIIYILFVATLAINPGRLKIVVNNIKVGKGNIIVEIYHDDKDFFKNPIASKTIKASSESLDISFELPDGTYAVAAYQDINENKKLDKGFLNIPKEPYGLSNGFRPRFSAPSFDDCKFKLTQELTITIVLK